ncbi:MAG: catalase [Moraxellaceae bacterium]|jgi:catalase|nr:catalase [Moraxellaceae bacterium]
MSPTRSQQVVDELNELFGFHDGYRTVHAKGRFLTGEFIAAPAAARLTRAPHMQGGRIQVTARFSNGNGNPALPDFLPDVRGLAVSFHLPAGQRTDIVAATLPRFPVRTPAGVLALVRALRPRLTMPLRLTAFLLRHPEFLRSLPANLLALRRPPASYASARYYAIHAYRWMSPYGSERFVRYRWVPEQEKRLGWLRALLRGRDYLQHDLEARLRNGPVRMHLQVQVARPGDPVSDPSAAWPEDREIVTVGTLELRALDGEEEAYVFDPLRITDGIGPSDDPVLLFRTQAYTVSAERRGALHRPQHVKAA